MIEKRIEIRNLNKTFEKTKVLDDFSCDFNVEKVNVIMGPSGKGKTTLLNVLMGLEERDTIENTDISPNGNGDMDDLKWLQNLKKAVVFQEDRLCENLSVSLNIRMPHQELKGKAKETFEEKLKKLLEEIDLLEYITSPVKELSGGQKRRIAILRAVLSDAQVIYFDEALKGLDKNTKDAFMKAIMPFLKGKIVFWVTHDKSDLEYFASKIVIEL